MIARVLGFGARAAGGAPIWLWVIGGLLIALGGLEVARRLQVAALETKVAKCSADAAQERQRAADTALRQAQAHAAETARRIREQQEAQHAHAEVLAAAQRDAAAARAASLRMSSQLAAFTAAHRRAAADPAAGPGGAPAAAALDLLADLLSRSDQTAGELGEALDRSHAAGQLCERQYDALTLKPK